jgi:hypothetical protein
MLNRCLNKNASDYSRYGGAGVQVCKQWSGRNGFINFLKDMGERPSIKHSMGRFIDIGNYQPGNCKWMTDAEQKAEAKKKREFLKRKKAA